MNLGFWHGGRGRWACRTVAEAQEGERLGFGTGFISERWNVKEASSLVGAACAVTDRMQIATAATNCNTRHPPGYRFLWPPLCTAPSHGTVHPFFERDAASPLRTAPSASCVTTSSSRRLALVTRRLWHGETVINHQGPIGSYPVLYPTVTSTKTSLGWSQSGPEPELEGRLRRRHPAHLLHPGHARTGVCGIVKTAAGRTRPRYASGPIGDYRRSPARRSTPEKSQGLWHLLQGGTATARRDEK